MMTWNYRVFREESGEYVIREVSYHDDGSIAGCTQNSVEPWGESFEELVQEIANFQEALTLPVLTLAEVDAEIAKRPVKPKQVRGTISHKALVKKLGLEDEMAQDIESPVLVGAEQ